MKKFFLTLILLIFLSLVSLITILSTIGIETNRFNNFILKKINQANNNINLELTTIKFKLDVEEISLFFDTNNPVIKYRESKIPVTNIRVYMDFISLIKSSPKITKINLVLNQIDIKQLKKISINLKPSNFTSFIKNKIQQGKISTEIEVYLDDNNLFNNFIARGSVSNLKVNISKEIDLDKTSFSFFADKSDILLKNILSEAGIFKISDGDIKLKLSSGILLESNFKTNLKYDNKLKNYTSLIRDFKYGKNLINLEADLSNSITINFDETYKVKKYDYKASGKILKANFNFEKPFENYFLSEKINQLSLIKMDVKTKFNSKKKTTDISGKYSINKDVYLPFNLSTIFDSNLLNLKLDADYNKPFELELINYTKPNKSIANISINLDKKKNNLKIKKLNLIENNNSIFIEDIIFKNDKFLSFKKIEVKTNKGGKINNDFAISFKKDISIKGIQFDATNLPKILNQKPSDNKFGHINKNIEIDFANIKAPLSENLKNFKLIGKIEDGKFTKISSKGDFGENNFLDITMKKDQKNKKKYLEIYSDLTRPLLTEYNFFKGLTGGKLLYSSVIDGNKFNSKLKIENFKVVNAPGMIKLLSLADLSGLADLAEGSGLTFDILEINLEKKNNLLTLNEIIALGPSISVLMEGYQDSNITSLKGTLVPAKTFNKIISKIPVLGDIIIPKEIGEGLFGISFKMKGPPGKIKTTINPLRTITPRFIQKIINRKKISNNFN